MAVIFSSNRFTFCSILVTWSQEAWHRKVVVSFTVSLLLAVNCVVTVELTSTTEAAAEVSLSGWQVRPSSRNWNPLPQRHWNEPGVLKHSCSQFPLSSSHSSMSVKGGKIEFVTKYFTNDYSAFFGITDTVRSNSIFLVLPIELVTSEASTDDPTEENGTFLFWIIER